jgi:hypothetical protein
MLRPVMTAVIASISMVVGLRLTVSLMTSVRRLSNSSGLKKPRNLRPEPVHRDLVRSRTQRR